MTFNVNTYLASDATFTIANPVYGEVAMTATVAKSSPGQPMCRALIGVSILSPDGNNDGQVGPVINDNRRSPQPGTDAESPDFSPPNQPIAG